MNLVHFETASGASSSRPYNTLDFVVVIFLCLQILVNTHDTASTDVENISCNGHYTDLRHFRAVTHNGSVSGPMILWTLVGDFFLCKTDP